MPDSNTRAEQLPRTVLFTDLDGTLLDPVTYSHSAADPAIAFLKASRVPIVFCSAKTAAEQLAIRDELGIGDPFIVENGSAIFVPGGYFPFGFDHERSEGEYSVIELGTPGAEIREALARIKADTRVAFRSFGDMSVDEVAGETGLDRAAAARARQRQYGETVKLEGPPEAVRGLLAAVKASGLRYAHGGRFCDIVGPTDKGRAASRLIDLFRRAFGEVRSVGIGDSPNDEGLLAAVDVAILVERAGGGWREMEVPALRRIEGVGPVGFRRAVERLGDLPG